MRFLELAFQQLPAFTIEKTLGALCPKGFREELMGGFEPPTSSLPIIVDLYSSGETWRNFLMRYNVGKFTFQFFW